MKVALLYQDDPIKEAAFAYLKAQLQQRGIDVVDSASWDSSDLQDFSSDVIKFRADGVTHLFMDADADLFYPQQAQAQGYFARYAVESSDYIQPFLEDFAPPDQLRGMMGVGWVPTQDVDLAHNPGPNAGQASCLAIMRQGGVDLSEDNCPTSRCHDRHP